MSNADLDRRFGGIARLYGPAALAKLRSAHVCVAGIGGVGSWTVEALARSAVGEMTLIDLDMVAESNTNRQIHALEGNFGKAKVDAMAERIRDINPECRINTIEDFITADNLSTLLARPFSVVVDAIDQTRVKIALAAHCRGHRQALVTVGAAGGQSDPTRITVTDLARTEQDPLLAKVRAALRRHHQFPRGKEKFGIAAVYSSEPLRYPDNNQACSVPASPAGLNCAGFGSSVCVTAVFGMVAAAQAIDAIIKQADGSQT